ncbi:hypothetical protein [Nannocystis sp. SCPEA4]|uniref:MlaD family protein n=1 Tax=Nannocystis sp. SCPEA4 TaxID=2996787 RepID=UPI002270FCA5|nr:hypothetical protein [Nannocystis sp. SCPEA4]MCY1057433.1 hypothetical protein [Nannocystis sp. SCPEA4]
MAGRSEQGLNQIVGLTVIISGILIVVGLIVFSQGKNLWKPTVTITADFRQVSGLREGSAVQIEGMEIGTVVKREFVWVDYPCNPQTEDRGRFGQGRTDDCDRTMFCANEGRCAELESYSFNKDLHAPCEEDSQCSQGEVCVTAEMRRRYRGVLWTGGTGICDGFTTDHSRIRVTLSVFQDSMMHIRDDSRAVISQNGVLGDQIIQISVGRGQPIVENGRIQTTPSMTETIDAVKEKVDGGFVKVEEAIGGIAELAAAMGDGETVKNIQDRLAAADENLRNTAAGKGTVGAMLNDEDLLRSFGSSLRGVRDGAADLDHFLAKGQKALTKFDDSMQPLVDDGRKKMAAISNALHDPYNVNVSTRLLYDSQGKMLKSVQDTLGNVNKIVAGIERGEGTVGRLVRDPKVYDDMVEFFRGLQRDAKIQFLIRWALSSDKPERPAR